MPESIGPGRQLAAAARRILSPLGCKQIGRSRTWIADQRFWVIVIELQPSSFSRGSYLNVGVSWLWYAKGYWSFDHGCRVEGFHPFRDEHQFANEAEELMLQAAEEVHTLRTRFASLPSIARELTPKSDTSAWPVYHAAVAAGLAGDVVAARRLFNRLIREPPTAEWHQKLHMNGMELTQTLADRDGFRQAVLAVIQESRALHHLPPDPACLEGA